MPGDLVWMPDCETEAVIEQEVASCSYNVSTPGSTLDRNRRSLIQILEGPSNGEMEPDQILSKSMT
jgi:hypothetical protein